jgi:hypothetical protein
VVLGVVVLVVLRRVVRPREVVVGSGAQGSIKVLYSTPQPLYGQAASHGASSVAVGTDNGQPHGTATVETN